MFNTKLEVDKHVENCLRKITNEKERNNRSYTFAKLYYNVGDYELTRRYVSSYLSVKPKSPEGHYLLGVALEKLGKKDAALDAYRTSLQLDPKQNNLVLKVCELLSNDVDLDVAGAKYFCELAENVDPHNPCIYNLKEKLIMAEHKNPESVTKLLLEELDNRPTDVNLRIRLLRNFLQNNKINEAYKHVHDIERKHLPIFSNILIWQEMVYDILVRYKRQSQPKNLTWSFWSLLISVLDKLVGLRLDEKTDSVKESSDYIGHLFAFDQSLYEASKNINDCPDRQLAKEFLDHYSGQLYLHFATTILKQAKKDLIPFKEAAAITLPLFFIAYHLKPVDLHASWINHLEDSQKKFIKRWHQEAAFRCSQSGHTLLSAAHDRKSFVIAKATQHSSGMWKEQLFKKVFVIRDQQLKLTSSYFVTSHSDVTLKLPSEQELLEFDEESFYVYPDSLQHYIWVSLNNELPNLNYTPFKGLQYSVKNLNNCGAETLSLLDVQAFVYCATLTAQSHLKSLKQMLYYNVDRPNVLPEAITGQLGTVEQTKFLISAYKMHKCEPGFDSGELRLILIRGIEAVRCVGRHGLDVRMLVHLANIFAQKAEKCRKQSEIEFNDARAELYWKTALPLLDKLKNGQAITYSTNRIFEYKTKELSLPEVSNHIDKGKLFLGVLAMKRKEYEKALSIFEELKDPYASFHQAQIYKQMADHQMHQHRENVTSEMRSQNIILLSKARDCFYLTLDRLREPSVDKNHPLNLNLGTEIEKIEILLSRIDPDCINRNDCDIISDENVSSADSAEHYTSANYTAQFSNVYSSPFVTRNNTRNNHSTPMRLDLSKKEARPSPERLDAQLRQLIASKDATMSQVLEQNKIMLDSHKCLVDELRGFKEAVYNLSGQVDNLKTMKTSLEELKDIKKSIDELKNSVDELQSFRNVADIVYELKKEIANLKKDSKLQQVSDDMYVLDEDYSEYNVGTNFNYNPNLYANFPHRIPPPAVPPAAALYPHGLYPSLYGSIPPYAYPNIGLTQQALGFGTEQQLQPDLRGMTNAMAQVTPLYPPQSLAPNVPTPLNLTTSNVNMSILTGQSLSQVSAQPNIFKDGKHSVTSMTTSSSTSVVSHPSSISTKSAPVNVVITSSDPLPALQSSVSQPILSVTIPPHHIKGNSQKTQPHSYQIPLPTTSVSSTPSVLNKPAPAISTEGMLSNVAPPVYSAIADKKQSSKNLGIQIEKSLDETFSPAPSKTKIPPLDQSEPNEIIAFECPAKLYTINEAKEFKERGSGLFKLLENKSNNAVRIMMSSDLGKVLANHYVTKDLKMASMKDNTYYWSAPDYSEGKQKNEKFCLKFKNSDDAQRFYETFEKCKQKLVVEVTSTNNVKDKENSKNQSTTTFGGFVFTSSPIFKPKEAESPEVKPAAPVDNKTKSPFANFSFGSININDKIDKVLSPIASTPPKVVEQKSIKTPEASRADNSLGDDFVPTAEFEPVVPLPDMVEVKTGEEDAEVLFDCRAKLLRFDSEKKEWKERGLGNMKVLKEKSLIRLLMRREQIHKVCCNHQLLKNMNFQYMRDNFKVLTWCAQDFAEEVLQGETFAIRFKTEDQASDFLRCILNAQSLLNDDNNLQNKETTTIKEEKKVINNVEMPKQGFGNAFKPAKGSWECKNCYIVNDSKDTKCVACETSKSSPDKNQNKEQPKPAANVPAKASTGWGEAFKPKPGTWECECCLIRNESHVVYCVSCNTPKNDTVPKKESKGGLQGISLDTPFKFNFGIGTTPTSTTEPPKTTDSTFKFGAPTAISTTGFGFGSATFSFQTPPVSKAEGTKSDNDQSGSFVLGTGAAHSFGFKPRSPRKSSGHGEEGSDCSYVEEEADIYFKPVIPLPNKVEVKTGEENEEILYCHRAKLFRFTSGEWKERGIGDLKILRNRNSGKLRVLMRRDQVLKICLNHALTPQIEYRPKDDKTWLFAVADFSEGNVSTEQFCIRFKTAEIAQNFKDAIDKALSTINVSGDEIKDVSNDDSEVEFISETFVTAKEVEEARKFYLPPKFFAYRKLPSCSCQQCSKDDEYFKGTILQEDSTNTTTPKTSKSDTSNESPQLHSPKNDSSGDVTLKNLLIKPPRFGQTVSTKTTENVFVTPPNPEHATTPFSSTTTTAGNLFGSKFGSGTNLFGSKPTTDSSANSFSFLAKFSENNPAATPPSTNLFTESNKFSIGGITDKTNIFAASSADGDSTVPKTSSTPVQSTTKNLFGSNSATSLFSTPTTNLFGTPTTNIFGNQPSITTTAASIFGTGTATTASVFGTQDNKSTNMFGSPKLAINPFGPVNTGSLFGNSASLFGSGAKLQFGKGESIFGPAKENLSPANPLFGNNTKEQSKPDNVKEDDKVHNSSLASESKITSSTTELSGTNAKTQPETGNLKSVFKNTSDVSFSSLAQQNSDIGPKFPAASDNTKPFGSNAELQMKTENLKENDDVVLKCSTEISFSSLAQQNSNIAPTFAAPSGNTGNEFTPFAFPGAGATVFGSKKEKQSEVAEGDSTQEANESNVDDDYDPQYEPIIPMPEAIVVCTGEEKESIVFNERAKLYRYDVDTKEWKERGVGQMKILFHPENGTYRFLLRREQVHKIVLNQLITANLELQPMTTSDRAWVWAGHNYVEDEMFLEKLAVRFKYQETAQNFFASVQACLAALREAQAHQESLPATIQNYGIESVSSDSDPQDDDHEEVYDDEDDLYDDDDEEDERNMMFFNTCTLEECGSNGQWVEIGHGEIQLRYDPEYYGSKISFFDEDGALLCNNPIGTNTVMTKEENICIWKGVELASEEMSLRILRAIFDSNEDANQFHECYLKALSLALEWGITDTMTGEVEETD